MDTTRNLDKFLGAHELALLKPTLRLFWERYRKLEPGHEIFRRPNIQLDQTVPYYLHADEGRSLKKKGILIFALQPAFSTIELRKRCTEQMRCNLKGNTFATRFLLATMMQRFYAQDHQVLDDLLEPVLQDLRTLEHEGIQLKSGATMWTCCLGQKGDWSWLVTSAKICRSYRNSRGENHGICHLCHAGFEGFPWEDTSSAPAFLGTLHSIEGGLPWNEEAAFPRLLASPEYKPKFHRPDIFHNLQLGQGKEFAASAIASLFPSLRAAQWTASWSLQHGHFLSSAPRPMSRHTLQRAFSGSLAAAALYFQQVFLCFG